MANYYAQTNLLSTTAATEDNWSNTFALGQIGTLDLTAATDWVGFIKAFYDDCITAGAMRSREQNGHSVKIYQIGQPQPNYPLYELPFNLASAPGAVTVPLEVSLCVSYSNTIATTVQRARRRGRIYVSGWGSAALGAGVPTTGAQEALLDAYSDYVLAANTLASLQAGVWSRVNDTVYPVDTVWVDNAWDTQRRRGTDPTGRLTWTLP